MKRLLTILGALACVAVMGLTGIPEAEAHSLFIQAGRYKVVEGKSSPFFFGYGHHFPVDDAVRRNKLEFVRVVKPSGEAVNIELRDEKCLHSYLVDYDQPGTWTLVAATTPGHFTTWIDDKGRERHSIKPMSKVMDKASSIKTALRSSQWTKTYVTCEGPSEEFPAAVGLPLELVPMVNPASLKQGDTLVLQVYREGKPFAGTGYWDATYMGFSTQAEDMYIQRTEVGDGLIKLPLDTTGRWFVRFFVKLPAPEEDQAKYLHRKLTTTLVFELPNERKRPKLDTH